MDRTWIVLAECLTCAPWAWFLSKRQPTPHYIYSHDANAYHKEAGHDIRLPKEEK